LTFATQRVAGHGIIAAGLGDMAYLFATIAGLIGAAAGWAGGNALQPLITEYRALLPDIDIIRSAIDTLNPEMIGAAVGLLVAASLTLRIYGGHRTLPALAWRSLAVALAVALFGGATLRVGAVVVDQFGMNADIPSVAFEIRLPTGAALSKNDIQIELQTDKNQTIASALELVRDGEAPFVRGSVPILFRTADRMIVLSLPNEPVRLFKLRLSENPARHGEFGPWQAAELAGVGNGRRDTANIAIRYRVY
jgi:hypothetical protein